jgi:hypothetical protein
MRSFVGLEEDPGMAEFSGRASTRAHSLPERRPVVLGQGDQVSLAHAAACPHARLAGQI